MTTRISRRSLLLWLLPLLALLGYGAYLTDFGRNLTAEPVKWRKPAVPNHVAGVVPDIAFNADASPYVAISERNLFVPWRKPAPPPEPPPPPPEPPKPQIRRGVYTLTGTMQIGEQTVATVKETATNRTRLVKVGDTLQEFSVKTVEVDRVVLTYAGQEEELMLARYTQSGRATPPKAVAAPVGAAAPNVQHVRPGVPPGPVSQQPAPAGVPGGIPPRVAPPASGIQRAADGTFVFPPAASAGPGDSGVPPQPQPVGVVPVTQSPQNETIDVSELLRRRREARRR